MFIIDLSSSPLCDVERCVYLMEESGISLLCDSLSQTLKLLLKMGFVDLLHFHIYRTRLVSVCENKNKY